MTRRPKKRSQAGVSIVNGARLRTRRPEHVLAVAFQFDQTRILRTLKLPKICDEFTTAASAVDVRRSTTADDSVSVLDEPAAR